jgi:endonuclease/exonuclease/phosphatase family metal-dependent hydrolase
MALDRLFTSFFERALRHVRPALALVVLAAATIVLGAVFEFTRPDRPDVPRVSDIAGRAVRVSWQPVLSADHYDVTVSRGYRRVTGFRVEATEAQIPKLEYDTEYRVSVTAVDERESKPDLASRSSEPVEVRTLRRGLPALLPPTSPTVAEARPNSLTIGWEPVIDATTYEVEVSAVYDFETSIVRRSTSRRAVVTGLDAATPYYVRIRALGARGTTSDWAPVLHAQTILATDPLPLAVATYNVKCHSCGGPSWKSRRFGVAATIASRGLDVVGLQEAQQSGGPQFEDLLNALNDIQDGWEITSRKVNGTLGVRIFYNTRTVKLLDQGGVRYRHQGNSDRHHQRYYVWGLFQQRSSGKRFWFFNTHIDPDSLTARVAQGKELGKAVARMRGNLPAIAVGDFNASQFKVYEVHEAMTKAGLVDPLGVREDSHRVSRKATAERRIHTNFDSYNDFSSRPKRKVGPRRNGRYIDYIFTTPMRVTEFENVVNLDSKGRYRRAASDHNMLRAIVGLP